MRLLALNYKRAGTVAILAVFIGFCVPAPAYAQLSAEQKKYYRNHILYLLDQPSDGAACAGAETGANAGGGAVVDSDNARTAYDYFVAKGLAPFRAAAIVGNLQQESGVNPRSQQGGGGPGRGIAQWSVDGRWRDLQTYAAGAPGTADDRDIYDIVLQLDFMWHELNFVPTYKKALASLQASTTIEQATGVISSQYEQAGQPHMEARIRYANAVLSLYGNGAPANGPPAAGGLDPNASGGSGGGGTSCPVGDFTGVPGQTKPQGKGYTLAENTDYSATPCAPGTTETNIYVHPIAKFKVRLCKIGATGIIVASIISEATLAMINAAKTAGVTLNGGGFRDYETQLDIYTSRGCPCNPPVAKPGNSQHERGLAIDFSSGGTIRRGSPQFTWLSANAAQYGFHNLPSESWHWSTSGN